MKREIGSFEIRDKDLAGRIGRLYTPHGILETPALLPVVDPVRQEVPLEEIEKIGFNAIITNAYLLLKRKGREAAEHGVHKLLGFNGIIMTDSGAYQILEYGSIEVSPAEIVEFQKSIGSDIAVILDIPTGNARDRGQAEYSVRETIKRAWEATRIIDSDKRIWTLPIQGGPFKDLVELGAKEASKIPGYRLYALGSPTVLMERYEYWTLAEMIITARFNTPITKPLHLFGAGHPMIIPFAVALGVDMFDSASYILYARDDRYMTLTRTYRLDELDYLPCSCPVCSKYTAEELREMPKSERVKLIATHNLYVLKQAINEVKQAIKEGRLWELLEEKSRIHPSLARMLNVIKQHADKLERLSPRVKGGFVKGVFLYGPESLYNPRIIMHHRSLLERYKPRHTANRKLVLAPVNPDEKPFTHSNIYKLLKGKENNAHIIGYILYLGLIPEELAETYPNSQFEINTEPYSEVVEKTSDIIVEFLKRNTEKYSEIIIYMCNSIRWSTALARAVLEKAKKNNIIIKTRQLEHCRAES